MPMSERQNRTSEQYRVDVESEEGYEEFSFGSAPEFRTGFAYDTEDFDRDDRNYMAHVAPCRYSDDDFLIQTVKRGPEDRAFTSAITGLGLSKSMAATTALLELLGTVDQLNSVEAEFLFVALGRRTAHADLVRPALQAIVGQDPDAFNGGAREALNELG